MNENFVYHTKAKDEAEAIVLCKQCYSNPLRVRKSTSTYSNVVIDKAEVKDGVWTVTGSFDVVKTDGIVAK